VQDKIAIKALLELPLILIHKTEKRREMSQFRGYPKHSHGMLDQVLIDTIARCINGLSQNHPDLRHEIVSSLQTTKTLLTGLAYGAQFLKDLIAKRGISPAAGTWLEVNMDSEHRIDMRYLDLDGSLKRLNAMVASDEATKWLVTNLSMVDSLYF